MSSIIGHEAVLRELRALASSPEPPHALLFAGPQHTGRHVLAREYARLLNCERRPGNENRGGFGFGEVPGEDPADLPCGACRACRHIAEGTHPDVVVVSPGDTLCRPRGGDSSHPSHAESRDIRICQVRGIIDAVARFPFEAQYRVVIIDPAERMTEDAANTLLKTLEEPPGHTAFVLITSAPESIIETVLSRCRRVDLRTVPRPVIEAGLLARGASATLAAASAAAARGKPGLAVGYAAEPDLIASRERVLQRCGRLSAAGTGERFRYSQDLTERWRRDRAQIHSELALWEDFWEAQLKEAAAGGEQSAALAPLGALQAIAAAREQLLAQVLPHLVFDLMLLSFPRTTLSAEPEEEPALNA
ncbi:MAG: ATP-binding protein [Dehalococcoidia bacterium]